jgi:hypothetical protein
MAGNERVVKWPVQNAESSPKVTRTYVYTPKRLPVWIDSFGGTRQLGTVVVMRAEKPAVHSRAGRGNSREQVRVYSREASPKEW